jgi:hypothetical protein
MKKSILLFTLLSLTISSAWAKGYIVTANLNGNNVVPSSVTTNTGTLTGTFDDVTGLLTFSITYTPCGPIIQFHSGAAGTNGPLIFSVSSNCNPPTSGTRTLTAPEITSLLAGNIYVELDYFPTKIRGQLAATLVVDTYNNAARNDFYGIGGYSFTQQFFPDGVQPTPYVVSGPSPQNDFSFAASAVGGITNRLAYISTTNTNTAISIKFFGNNVRKFGCNVLGINATMTAATLDIISLTATTNLGNTATQTGGGAGGQFVGFNVIGNENEYIVSVTASFQTTPSPVAFIILHSIMVGDNTPQNVALNFDGVDDYVSIPSTVGNFATNDNFTISCWIKPDLNQSSPNGQFYANENDIITKRNDVSASVSNPYPFEIRYLNNNRTTVSERNKIRVGQWDGTNFPFITSTTPLNDGKWHHVAFVRESGNFKLYIDGVQEGGTVADNATGTTTNAFEVQIGRRVNNQNFFKGEIDEVRIIATAKTEIQIRNERFCKNPDSNSEVGRFNFSNGVPHDNNALITQVQDAVGTNHGTLNNFARTGDASNFVTGQVKYVKKPNFGTINGSSWATSFIDLQSALTANTCNDLFDVYVAKQTYLPTDISDINASFNIPTGMSIYGGFAGTEKSINHRNKALILTTNETTLSGDLGSNDILSDFTQNRTDNSRTVVNVGGKSNIIIDGFSIRGGFGGGFGGGILANSSENIRINHCKIFDNSANSGGGISANDGNNLLISNTYLLGNRAINDGDAIYFFSFAGIYNMTLSNCVVAGHTGEAIFASGFTGGAIGAGTVNHSYTNCTFANNGTAIRNESVTGGSNNFTLKNSIINGNTTGISVTNLGGTYNENITYSLVQGVTSGTGNLNGNTTNPQFVNPTYTNPNNAGDYRLKWCSKAIGAGDNAGISPLDLDRNPRNFNGTADMGAFEFLGNTPSPTNAPNSSITGTIDSPTYAGGAIQTITSTAKVIAPAGKIDFKAPNSILLNPGFEARGMSNYFKAEIGANQTCVN